MAARRKVGRPRKKKAARTGTGSKRAPTPARTGTGSKRAPTPAHIPLDGVSLLLDDGTIRLRPPPDAASKSTAQRRLQRAAMQWSYILRNRRRWTGSTDLAHSQEKRARELLEQSLGVGAQDLQKIANARILQAAIPYSQEEHGWESRVLPWEFVLTGATRSLRSGNPLTVMRQLRRANSPPRSELRSPSSALFVESAPGPMAGEYTFDSERQLMQTNLNVSKTRWHELKNPTKDQLRDAVRDLKPDAIHLAGFDNHQVKPYLEKRARKAATLQEDEARNEDGYVLATPQGELDPVGAVELASILTSGKHRPLFVGCGFWNSGSRVAALAVAAGVRNAVGFQDSFDDALAEVFFGAFYRHWCHLSGDVREAFCEAMSLLRDRTDGLLGTGVVLWSEAPLVGDSARVTPTVKRQQNTLRSRLRQQDDRLLDPSRYDQASLEKLIKVNVEPFSELNYSLLHNRCPLFKRFEILKLQPGRMMEVDLNIELWVGAQGFPFRRSLEIRNDRPDLSREIHSALTASLARSLRESISTSLLVEVKWGPHLLKRDTYRVRLLPPDQWRDTDADRIWLPSFVLPRDPAVGDLLEKAQHYVRVLRDDPTAGFDGYQSVDPKRDDPTEDVDLQVQSIWSALVHEWRLGYVNPPPTYSKELDSQRLRTPSCIRESRSGTCIDLSLLFASCLELVDIYPVIFLLEGHAFPGYWRTEEDHERFLEVSLGANGADANADDDADATAAPPPHSGFAGTQSPGWFQGRTAYPEIVRQIDEGHLVPIESVQLTEQKGFWSAVEAGQENLRPRNEFHSMLDIVSARSRGVTPLPLWEDPA